MQPEVHEISPRMFYCNQVGEFLLVRFFARSPIASRNDYPSASRRHGP